MLVVSSLYGSQLATVLLKKESRRGFVLLLNESRIQISGFWQAVLIMKTSESKER